MSNIAHIALSKTKIGGKELIVDFCGSKSTTSKRKGSSQAVNPLELFINGIPASVTREDIKNVDYFLLISYLVTCGLFLKLKTTLEEGANKKEDDV
uniref:40S ribosomal protein S6 n=1 Tax=Heterorhabditis bacteriophora TaxID=37862 RepID=A0A1I7WMP3_HETBA